MLKRLLNSIAHKMGYAVVEAGDHCTYDLEQEARQHIDAVRSHTMVVYEKLVTLYQQAVFCERQGLAGSFVECGTWKGGAVGLMALANLAHGQTRRDLHLFDSFAGIPEPNAAVDGESAVRFAREAGGKADGQLVALKNAYRETGTLAANKELLEERIGYPKTHLHYHEGWFQDTLPQTAAELGDIAILRLDGDWYDSTRVCLQHLYDKVVRGGFIIIDDYGCYAGCKKAVDEYMQENAINAYLHHIDREARYWLKP